MSGHLEQLHAGFAVDPGVLGGLVRRAVGQRLATAERVVRGYDNEVYRVRTTQDQVVFVRISGPGSEHHFAAEAAAMELARAAGVPVPEVLALDAVSTSRGEQEVMVVTAALGRPAADVWPGLDPDQRTWIMRRLGRVLDTVHTVTMPGVWRPDAAGHWPGDISAGFLAERVAEVPLLAPAGVDEVEAARIEAVLHASPRLLSTDVPVLLHGDVNLEHVFVGDDLEVSALIDWGMWCGGRPTFDFATAALSVAAVDLDALLEGSDLGAPDDPAVIADLATATIAQAVGHLAHHVTVGDTEPVDRMLSALRRSLATLSASTGET